MKYLGPDRRTHELNRIWHSLTINDRISWLRLARAMGEKQAPAAFTRIIDMASIMAFILTLIFPPGLRYILLAVCAGYVMAVNWAIMKMCWEGIQSR